MSESFRSTPLEKAVDAALAFDKDPAYLSHPNVREYRGTANGDSPEAWRREYVTELCRAILSAAFPPSETRALDLLKEARPYLDLIAPSVCKERPLVMVQTQCDVEALAKRIDGLIGEQA